MLYHECCDCSIVQRKVKVNVACHWCEYPPQYGWRPWPPQEVGLFVELAVSRSADHPSVRTILIATALEALLEDVLLIAFHWGYGPHVLVELLLDSYRGLERRAQLFRGVTGLSLPEALSSTEHQDFWTAWQSVVRARNAFAHGRLLERTKTNSSPIITPVPAADPTVLDQLQSTMLAVFAQLRWVVKKQVDPKVVPPPLFPFEEEPRP